MSRSGARVEAWFLPYVGDDPRATPAGETDVPALAYINLRVTPIGLRCMAETNRSRPDRCPHGGHYRLLRTFPGMRAFANRGSIISSNDGGTRSVNLDITGQELADIYRVAGLAYAYAEEAFDNLASTPRPGRCRSINR
jgi:hypothetical protein